MTTTHRRPKGEHSITQLHDHPSCPAKVDGVRPGHTCRGRYQARAWVEVNGERKRKAVYGTTKKEAIAALKAIDVAQANRTLVLKSMSVEDWLEHWLSTADLKVSTLKGYRSLVHVYLVPQIGHYRLDKLQAHHLDKMYAHLRVKGSKTKGPLLESTVSHVHTCVRRALQLALYQNLVAVNVATMLVPPKTKTSKRRKGLTVEQSWKVLVACGEDPRFWLALMHGMRQGECLGLRWMDLHLDHRGEDGLPAPFLEVAQAATWQPKVIMVKGKKVPNPKGGGWSFDTPKGDESRVVHLTQEVADRLRLLRDRREPAEGPEGIVFQSRIKTARWPNGSSGKPVSQARDNQHWHRMLDKAGVPHTPLHAARNTATQLLTNAGVDRSIRAQSLGHSETMNDRYGEGNDPAQIQAARSLDKFMAEHQPRHLQAVQ